MALSGEPSVAGQRAAGSDARGSLRVGGDAFAGAQAGQHLDLVTVGPAQAHLAQHRLAGAVQHVQRGQLGAAHDCRLRHRHRCRCAPAAGAPAASGSHSRAYMPGARCVRPAGSSARICTVCVAGSTVGSNCARKRLHPLLRRRQTGKLDPRQLPGDQVRARLCGTAAVTRRRPGRTA
jgi:hypothetical protein